MGIIWTIIIGLIAGVIAKFIMPGSSNEPSGFILTAILGIAGRKVLCRCDDFTVGKAAANDALCGDFREERPRSLAGGERVRQIDGAVKCLQVDRLGIGCS